MKEYDSAVCYTIKFFFLSVITKSKHKVSLISDNQTKLNRARYRKTVTSALWVQLTLVVCYLPFAILGVFLPQNIAERTPCFFVAELYLATLALLNSSLNPILYCWKIREVRQAAKNAISGLFCSSS